MCLFCVVFSKSMFRYFPWALFLSFQRSLCFFSGSDLEKGEFLTDRKERDRGSMSGV